MRKKGCGRFLVSPRATMIRSARVVCARETPEPYSFLTYDDCLQRKYLRFSACAVSNELSMFEDVACCIFSEKWNIFLNFLILSHNFFDKYLLSFFSRIENFIGGLSVSNIFFKQIYKKFHMNKLKMLLTNQKLVQLFGSFYPNQNVCLDKPIISFKFRLLQFF